jgi:quinol monooxygenase YgiN
VLIIAGWLRTTPGQRDAYLEACHRVVELARQAEGCLDFALSADPLDPDRINLHERWASGADLDRFRGSGPEPSQLAEIVDADVARYGIASVGPA